MTDKRTRTEGFSVNGVPANTHALDAGADIEAAINAEIEAGLAADRAKRREELYYAARRKIDAAHYDRINAKAPVEGPLAGLTPEQHAARLREINKRVAADMAAMDAANARPVEGSLLYQRKQASMGGSEGFKIKSGGS
jgi:hypothetical protein